MANTKPKKILKGVFEVDGEVRRFELRQEYDDSLSLYVTDDLNDMVSSWEDYKSEGYPLYYYKSLREMLAGEISSSVPAYFGVKL